MISIGKLSLDSKDDPSVSSTAQSFERQIVISPPNMTIIHNRDENEEQHQIDTLKPNAFSSNKSRFGKNGKRLSLQSI